VPSPFPICAAIVLSSAYGFAQFDAKVASTDYFFTGFPSYWNVVVIYLYVLQLSQRTNAIILATLAVLVFVPIHYVYPSRTKALMWPTLTLGMMWAVLLTWIIWRLPAVDGPWILISLIFPAYYLVLSLWLQFRR
jgi:phosphatidylcholine synthase